ncbi:MAG: HEAT repeat domain-containing protein [Thermoguttaceae bacterium]
MLKRRVLLGLCLVILGSGCEQSSRAGKPKTKSRHQLVARETSYKDKTPEEWLKYLRSNDVRRRNRAADALVQYGPDQIPAILAVLDDKSLDGPRLSAAQALGAYGEKAEVAVPSLVAALKETKWNGRDGAAMALGKIRQRLDVTIPALIGALQNDPDETVRAAAAEALGKIRNDGSPVVAALAKALEDKTINVRAEAAEALQKIGPKAHAALPALQKAAESSAFVVSQAATEAIKAIKGR